MSHDATAALIESIPAGQPVLIAGPTASGKSALALQVAATGGGVIVNADASQVYACWRIISARPSPQEEAQAPHRLYGHLDQDAPYSTGHWLREVGGILKQNARPIIVGGTGLYFQALTEGLVDIPATPNHVRSQADTLPLEVLLEGLTRVRLRALIWLTVHGFSALGKCCRPQGAVWPTGRRTPLHLSCPLITALPLRCMSSATGSTRGSRSGLI